MRTTGKDKDVDDPKFGDGSLQFALCDDDCYTAKMIHATSSRAGIDRRITFFECRVFCVFIRMVKILTLMNGLRGSRGVGYDHETPTVRC